jgi:hypothetical protein
MSSPGTNGGKPAPLENGGGLVGAGLKLSNTIVGALPPAFLLLVLLNLAFLGLVMWFIDDQIQQRTDLVRRVVEHCMSLGAQP